MREMMVQILFINKFNNHNITALLPNNFIKITNLKLNGMKYQHGKTIENVDPEFI